MRENKKLQITGVMLEKEQLKKHLEKIASSHNIISRSQKDTYPIPRLLEDYEKIKEVYKMLNEHVNMKINIHPAGEWLLDNFLYYRRDSKTNRKGITNKKIQKFYRNSNW